MLEREFFLGFIKIHLLYHASKEAIFGVAITEELARHGYDLSPGTLYPVLHRLEKAGYDVVLAPIYNGLTSDNTNSQIRASPDFCYHLPLWNVQGFGLGQGLL